ncbi:Major facilitator superfamily domain general substrate transporter [Penicillium cf. griseofulvum]|uniref:Major facilitator superfamily domain general substrate transporter n=1 Tax=Penicillium cf. griseofulvum TaxID=2972120 RepID=A0A9W9JSX0_9EURO|nr:Major facilitator superfamily domain general substrate transporter [Penicillium cf. griseofulvum]KAJ5451016.1 Major facilitator superfamily domain general substrate transporter [Penicillium cf. griseofulvum]
MIWSALGSDLLIHDTISAATDVGNSLLFGWILGGAVIGVIAVGVLGDICSWFVINTIGRRGLFPGMLVLTAIFFIIGILDVVPNYNPSIAMGQCVLIIILNFFYDLTLGPLRYVICGEMSSTRLRSYTISISFFTRNFWTLIMTLTVPYMINPDEGHLRGKTGFIFGDFSIIASIWTCFCLPETKGRTFEQLDHMFEQRIDLGTQIWRLRPNTK